MFRRTFGPVYAHMLCSEPRRAACAESGSKRRKLTTGLRGFPGEERKIEHMGLLLVREWGGGRVEPKAVADVPVFPPAPHLCTAPRPLITTSVCCLPGWLAGKGRQAYSYRGLSGLTATLSTVTHTGPK